MVELITKVHTDGKNYCAAVRERLLDGRRGGCEVIVWFSYLSPHLTSPTTKTLMAKLIFSAHSQPSPANIVRRKPAGVVITLTTLFLMFIHLPKYIRQISGNNEDCNRALSGCTVLCLLGVKNDQCFTSYHGTMVCNVPWYHSPWSDILTNLPGERSNVPPPKPKYVQFAKIFFNSYELPWKVLSIFGGINIGRGFFHST